MLIPQVYAGLEFNRLLADTAQRRCFAIVIRWICISIRAKDSPMHFRGPAENGSIVSGWRVRDSSGPKRSGLKRSGASQNAGCRWIKYGEM